MHNFVWENTFPFHCRCLEGVRSDVDMSNEEIGKFIV